jgi:hypothetical protein
MDLQSGACAMAAWHSAPNATTAAKNFISAPYSPAEPGKTSHRSTIFESNQCDCRVSSGKLRATAGRAFPISTCCG